MHRKAIQVLSIPKIHPSFIKDYNDVGHQDYVERGAHLSLSDYGHEYDYDQHDFEYDLGSFDYY